MKLKQLKHPTGFAISKVGDKPAAATGFITVNGLLGQPDGWQAMACQWGNANTVASWASVYYWEGIFGGWHQRHVQTVATLLASERALRPLGKQHAIGHSNGCSLLLEALVGKPELRIDDLHLIAAYVVRDCNKNGINTLLASGQVKRIFLYVSSGDDILGWNWLSGKTIGKNGPVNANPLILSFDAMNTITVSNATLIQANDDDQTHCSWVDSDTLLGFNLDTISKIVGVSI